MTNEELKQEITALSPTVTFDETGEFLNALVPPTELHSVMQELKSRPSLHFDYLFCLTCIDWKDHFMMVYHLLSKEHKHTLVLKSKLENCDTAEIETVSDLYKTADFHEREVYDLFGVRFTNHPDLRRLFLDEDWPGHPLRKDYQDENMIEL
jgi:NADH/F420H2 dehydrogenase subunit C